MGFSHSLWKRGRLSPKLVDLFWVFRLRNYPEIHMLIIQPFLCIKNCFPTCTKYLKTTKSYWFLIKVNFHLMTDTVAAYSCVKNTSSFNDQYLCCLFQHMNTIQRSLAAQFKIVIPKWLCYMGLHHSTVKCIQ